MPDDPQIEREGRERRRKTVGGKRRVDYSDKGDHDWYVISAYHKRCSKCQVIKDITFGDSDKHTQESTYYLTREGERQYNLPSCTWKGRAAR